MTAISKWSYLGLTRASGRINLKEVCRATMSGSGKKPKDFLQMDKEQKISVKLQISGMAAYSSVAML